MSNPGRTGMSHGRCVQSLCCTPWKVTNISATTPIASSTSPAASGAAVVLGAAGSCASELGTLGAASSSPGHSSRSEYVGDAEATGDSIICSTSAGVSGGEYVGDAVAIDSSTICSVVCCSINCCPVSNCASPSFTAEVTAPFAAVISMVYCICPNIREGRPNDINPRAPSFDTRFPILSVCNCLHLLFQARQPTSACGPQVRRTPATGTPFVTLTLTQTPFAPSPSRWTAG